MYKYGLLFFVPALYCFFASHHIDAARSGRTDKKDANLAQVQQGRVQKPTQPRHYDLGERGRLPIIEPSITPTRTRKKKTKAPSDYKVWIAPGVAKSAQSGETEYVIQPHLKTDCLTFTMQIEVLLAKDRVLSKKQRKLYEIAKKVNMDSALEQKEQETIVQAQKKIATFIYKNMYPSTRSSRKKH